MPENGESFVLFKSTGRAGYMRRRRRSSLAGSQDQNDYPLVETRWEGRHQLTHAPLIGGSGAGSSRSSVAGGVTGTTGGGLGPTADDLTAERMRAIAAGLT